MADIDRKTTTTPHTVSTTHVERSGGGKSALWLILGIALAAVVIFWALGSGFMGGESAGTAGDGGDTAVIVNEGASDAVEGAAGAVEGAAESVENGAEEGTTGN